MAKKVAEKKVEKKVEKKTATKKCVKKVEKKKPMTKSEMITALAEKANLNKKQVQDVYDNLVELAAAQVKECKEFTMHGIGKLVIKERSARTGRNPQTKEEIQIPAKTVVSMKVSKTLSDAIVG